MNLLNDTQMREFIVNGYVTVQADFPPAFHESVRAQVEAIFTSEGNPGNDILPRIPELADLCTHPAVTGALTSILGPGYAMHPHRHCHQTPPQQRAQRQHQDSYEDDQNVRHHRTRWAMAFFEGFLAEMCLRANPIQKTFKYYPQDVPKAMGPTSVLPASQYYISRSQAERQEEALVCGDAGTVTFEDSFGGQVFQSKPNTKNLQIVHYDLWRRATTNRSDRNRYMVKFLFCRMTEPTAPSWNCIEPSWRTPGGDGSTPNLWQSVWNWHAGQDQSGFEQATGIRAVGGEANCKEGNESPILSEADRLEDVYRLSTKGEAGTVALMKALASEAEARLARNLAAQHTNPSQLCAGASRSTSARLPARQLRMGAAQRRRSLGHHRRGRSRSPACLPADER